MGSNLGDRFDTDREPCTRKPTSTLLVTQEPTRECGASHSGLTNSDMRASVAAAANQKDGFPDTPTSTAVFEAEATHSATAAFCEKGPLGKRALPRFSHA